MRMSTCGSTLTSASVEAATDLRKRHWGFWCRHLPAPAGSMAMTPAVNLNVRLREICRPAMQREESSTIVSFQVTRFYCTQSGVGEGGRN
jgi:hypothetical protein